MRTNIVYKVALCLALLTFLFTHWACRRQADADRYRFQLLTGDQTGLDFENVVRASSEFNVFNYMYFFNGGGLAAGDFNNDGLVDLYFTSNMSPNKLFLNQGDLKFKDVTEAAGVAGMEGWTTGASVVDINNDGLLDIYVSQMGDFHNIKGRNQLYICQGIENGIPTYADEAIPYSLDLAGFATQAAFFDYDLDGDLDMYQLNHSLHANGTFGQKPVFEGTQHPMAGDKLLRNDGDKFTEVTLEAGINSTVIGYGLGIAVGDVNLDGWPDIYIGNDFHENDYLYINQQNGTFKEQLTEQMMHTSRFSMGVDLADINNDAFNEVISLDMLPEDPEILKSSLGEDDYKIFNFKLGYGYNHQYARNNLQLNNGNNSFSEIGIFAGVEATDWSWAPLLLDFDNDGYKDLFISNGIVRRMNDIDYVNFRQNNDIRWKANTENLEEEDLVVVEKMPKIKLPNRFFRNSGQLRFESWTEHIADDRPSYSNSAVYADLDNDGDLDVVVNNFEDQPFVYQNLAADRKGDVGGGYLSVRFTGPPQNRDGVGAKVLVYKGNERLYSEYFPSRGYQSSMAGPLHLGVGDTTQVDSVLVIWPDRTYERLAAPVYNQTLSASWRAGLPVFDYQRLRPAERLPFTVADVTEAVGLKIEHVENPFVEFDRENLIPHMVSADGPALAVGDANGDGRDDVFIGSSKRNKSKLLLQNANGRFYDATPAVIAADSMFEDVDAVWVDLENDGDQDLVIAAGGNEYWNQHEVLRPRAYINGGKGNFTVDKELFAGAYLTASCVLPTDYNGDGLVDFFFGARALPWNYGKKPTSYLFENKGGGRFEEVTPKMAPELATVGLVKDGAWADMDRDGRPDLVLAVEWQPIRVFYNRGDHFEATAVNDQSGWWNYVLPYDFDQDGDMDLLAGNTGKNSKLRPSPERPVRMYVNDFDDNGQIEQMLTYYIGDRELPFANYMELTKQMVSIKKRYLYAKDFAQASPADLVGGEKLSAAELWEANTFESTYFENVGGETGYRSRPLPDALQFSTQNAAALHDFDGDGRPEVLMAGNFYENNIEMGRYDADYGHVVAIGKDGAIQISPVGDLLIKGQVRRIAPVNIGGKTSFILAKNDDWLQVLQPNR